MNLWRRITPRIKVCQHCLNKLPSLHKNFTRLISHLKRKSALYLHHFTAKIYRHFSNCPWLYRHLWMRLQRENLKLDDKTSGLNWSVPVFRDYFWHSKLFFDFPRLVYRFDFFRTHPLLHSKFHSDIFLVSV
jgi:hypothetical protein